MPLEPKTQALEKTPQGELTVQRITAEPKWRRYFSGLAEHYSTMLHNAFSDAALIRQYEDVIYLVDADVVGNLAELTFPNNQAKRETAHTRKEMREGPERIPGSEAAVPDLSPEGCRRGTQTNPVQDLALPPGRSNSLPCLSS